ncbi:hypothetical protein BC938DRAFT_479219 [Jimgerdemannia flammicorona]|uniref:Uncharacterized protein n=1 Tax=Jimgerdemannia flammicorona TaxID=994334 RepID=A0A433QLD5_9FUNG|nr:hypothetical protein BC938DRAFT_479219 [Jimgerdemannia flammicorona]
MSTSAMTTRGEPKRTFSIWSRGSAHFPPNTVINPHYGLPAKNRDFIDRPEILKNMKAKLDESSPGEWDWEALERLS